MTRAPIYLVSACTSGEEFIAAFRRYADKNGLFIPIQEPLPVGCRGRFAVTLGDGGVMIEGEAEIVSSARTASVLHGRVGMTLRFLDPDPASKTLLRELERARLAMRPAPPSVPPRPAEVPAEPRPVPPPVQGRVDAVNAFAECVAIGDLSALDVPAAAATPAAPPKAGPRFVIPAAPAPPARAPAMGLGANAWASPSPPAASASPRVLPSPPPSPPGIAPITAITPITTPHAAPVDPLLSSGIVQATPAEDDVSARTQIHAGVPPRESPGAPRRDAPVAPSEVHAARSPAPAEISPAQRGPVMHASDGSEPALLGGATHVGTPPIPRIAAPANPRPAVHRPAPPIVAPARPAAFEVEIADPTDISPGPPEPLPEPPEPLPEPPEPLPEPPEPSPEPPPAVVAFEPPEPRGARQRKTVIGVVVAPSGVPVQPAAMAAAAASAGHAGGAEGIALVIGGEVIGPDRTLAGDSTVDASAPAAIPGPGISAMLDDEAASAGVPMPPGRARSTSLPGTVSGTVLPQPGGSVAPVAPVTPARPAAARPRLPSGDWTIAFDPEASDGWSAPVALAPPGHSVKLPPGPPPAATSEAPPPDAVPERPPPSPGEPLVEPKVQIDPTLIARPGPHAQPVMHPGEVSAYLMDPSYQRVLMDPSYQRVLMAGAPAPDPLTTGDRAPGNPASASEPASPVRTGPPRGAIIVIASALAAAAIGIVMFTVVRGKLDAGTPASPGAGRPGPRLVEPPPSPASSPDPARRAPEAPVEVPAVVPGRAVANDADAKPTFLVQISSTPEGATILLNSKSLGVTPTTVELPAFEASTLTITKDGYAPEIEKVTPTSNGVAVHTALKQLDREKPN